MAAKPNPKKETKPETGGITALSVSGFKSIYDECKLEIRPLTILAGANSSGKSSAIQPLLLLKQTLEASIDTGPIMMEGEHVRFTKAEQLLSRIAGRPETSGLRIGIGLPSGHSLSLTFVPEEGKGFTLSEMESRHGDNSLTVYEGMTVHTLETSPSDKQSVLEAMGTLAGARVAVSRDRCFLKAKFTSPDGSRSRSLEPYNELPFAESIRRVIHVSSSRKNPERTYPRTTTGPYFLGPFEPYCASIVADWKVKWGELGRLEGWMAKDFGMVCMVDARPIGDTQVELRVSRLPRRRGRGPVDMVNIYDVGQGVAQVLAATVALLVAERDQLVYIDEPELHLHPRAQGAMGRLLAFAAKDRGVRVVVETQSSLLLLAIQTLVAEGELPPGLVGLYWFQRDEDGATKVRPGSLDRAGAFEDWPVDFGDVELDAQRRYLDAGR